jgi:hypothetical protein
VERARADHRHQHRLTAFLPDCPADPRRALSGVAESMPGSHDDCREGSD